MTTQDFQDRLNALVVDLQTKGKGRTVNIMFREVGNAPNVLPLSSDANGVVNAAQLTAAQAFIDNIRFVADDYNSSYAPVQAANDAFKAAQLPHQALIDTSAAARTALQTALDADAGYQAAKTALDNARLNSSYIESAGDYKMMNLSENFAELANAKGKYV